MRNGLESEERMVLCEQYMEGVYSRGGGESKLERGRTPVLFLYHLADEINCDIVSNSAN